MASQSSVSGPLRHIGAQDALQLSPSIYGYVRVQRQMERMFKFMRWRRWFLLVSKGYIYIFKSEYSIKPRKIMHLNDYMKMMRLDSKQLEQHSRIKWGFKILPHDPDNMMIAAFACVSDEDRRRWMRCLRVELSSANDVENLPYPEGVNIEEEYVYLEKSVTQKQPPVPVPASKKPRPPAPSPLQATTSAPRQPSKEEVEEDHDDEDYTSINEEDLDMVQQPKKNIPRYKPAPPVEEKKMSSQHDLLTKEMYEFNSSNREEVQRLLEDKPDGTFLVRKARNTENQVLSIEIDCQLKEFKINELNGQVTIDSSLYFPTVEKLLIHYTKNNLPNKNIKLTKGYFFTKGPGYVNERL